MRFAAPLGHRIDFGARWGRGRFAALRRWASPFEADGSRTPCAARAARCRGEGRWKVVGLDRVGTADCASVAGLDRKSVVSGKSVPVRVERGGRWSSNKQKARTI